jgi:hypothetical protein
MRANSGIQAEGVHQVTLLGAHRQTSIDFCEGVLGMPFIFDQRTSTTPAKAISTSTRATGGSSPSLH